MLRGLLALLCVLGKAQAQTCYASGTYSVTGTNPDRGSDAFPQNSFSSYRCAGFSGNSGSIYNQCSTTPYTQVTGNCLDSSLGATCTQYSNNCCGTNTDGYCAQLSTYTSFCCYCPAGKYSSTPPTKDADCGVCPKGSYIGGSDNKVYGFITSTACIPCPAGYYADNAGTVSCSQCPSGMTTFTSNQYSTSSSGGTGFSVGATSKTMCTTLPTSGTSYLVKTASSNQMYLSGGFYPSTYTYQAAYYTACNTFGKVLGTTQGTATSPNSDAQCTTCPDSTPYFYAGGYTQLQSYSQCFQGFSGCVTTYAYGDQQMSSETLSDGGIVYSQYLTNVQAPSCLSSCPAGTGAATVGQIQTCAKCNEVLGQYNPTVGANKCKICPENSYPRSDGAVSCATCPFPYISSWDTSIAESSVPLASPNGNMQFYAQTVLKYRSCAATDGNRALCLCLPTGRMLAIVLPITFFFLALMAGFIVLAVSWNKPEAVSKEVEMTGVSTGEAEEDNNFKTVDPLGRKKPVLVGWRVVIGLMAYVTVPFVDNMTDLAFIVSNPFYNAGLFTAFVIFYCAPAFVFFKALLDKKAVPRFYIVPMPERFIFASYDSLWKSIVGFAVLVPFLLLNCFFLLPWTILGCLLYTTKAFAVRPVANLWLHVWTGSMFAPEGSPLWEQRRRDMEEAEYSPIDERVLNESLMAHICLETFPIVAIQFINNSLYQSWNGLAYFSVAFSIFNSFSGFYRIGYYKLYLRVPLTEIPVDFNVFGMPVFGGETTKALMGDLGSNDGRKHRFSVSRSVSGGHELITDDWIDDAGHVHHDKVKEPLLAHVAQDLVTLTERVSKLEKHTGIQID